MDSIEFYVQVTPDEPSFRVFDFRGSNTPTFVYQDMCRNKAPDLVNSRLVLDIGANVGLWTFRMAALYPECHFIAYEPFPINVKHFEMGLDKNGYKNVTLHALAVTEHGNPITLHMDPTNSGSAGYYNMENVMFPSARVPSVSLNSVFATLPMVDAMKLDIEGMEFHLFNGFEYWDKLKSVYMEIHPHTLAGTDEERKAQVMDLVGLLEGRLGKENVFVDCTDEKFR